MWVHCAFQAPNEMTSESRVINRVRKSRFGSTGALALGFHALSPEDSSSATLSPLARSYARWRPSQGRLEARSY